MTSLEAFEKWANQFRKADCSCVDFQAGWQAGQAALLAEIKAGGPAAFMAESGKVITADDAEMALKHAVSYFNIWLYRLPEGEK
jgi:hypothetical protein